MRKKTFFQILVLILFAVVAVASSGANKVSDEDAYDIGYSIGKAWRNSLDN